MSIMARIEKAQSTRQDGYSNTSPVFEFQREVERLAMPDYTALRSVLAMARSLNDSLSLEQLREAYRAIAK